MPSTVPGETLLGGEKEAPEGCLAPGHTAVSGPAGTLLSTSLLPSLALQIQMVLPLGSIRGGLGFYKEICQNLLTRE